MIALIAVGALMFAIRLKILYRVWNIPLKNGEDWFLAQRVPAGFYREAGVPLFRRFRIAMVVPLLLDLPLSAWLLHTWRLVFLDLEQLFAVVATTILYNILLAHFTARASLLVGDQEDHPATSVQLSMEPRRLRDHTNLFTELFILTVTFLAFALLNLGAIAVGHPLIAFLSQTHAHTRAIHQSVTLSIWVLYWQLGFFLLKGVFVRWRMALPTRRTEDFRRWRAAWLTHHLKILDAVRVLFAIIQLFCVSLFIYGDQLTFSDKITACAMASIVITVYFIYVWREGRRLAAIAREVKPIELIKEFPRPQIPCGRFVAGGYLFINRDIPRILVRGPQGLALNLAHPSTYAWAAYFAGLIVLMTWIAH
jgi:hypothetical protein